MPRKWNPRSGFQPGHAFYRSSKPGAYAAPRPPSKDKYEPVDAVPDGLTWKPAPFGGRAANNLTILYSLGNVYKLVRVRKTGAVTYYKLKDADAPARDKATIDAEPKRAGQHRLRVGSRCWYVDNGKWFLMTVVERDDKQITLQTVTGWDADRTKEWRTDILFQIGANGPLRKRLRPLKDRYI